MNISLNRVDRLNKLAKKDLVQFETPLSDTRGIATLKEIRWDGKEWVAYDEYFYPFYVCECKFFIVRPVSLEAPLKKS